MRKSQIIIFILTALSILAIIHLVIYFTIINLWTFSHRAEIFLEIAAVILSLSFVAASALVQWRYTKVGTIFYAVSAAWIGTALWLFFASVLSSIVLVFFSPLTAGLNFIRGFMGIAILVSIYGLVHARQTKTKKYSMQIQNLPAQWHGKKVVLISDLHLGTINNLGFARKIVKEIAAQQPELVIISGDYFDGTPTEIKKLAQVFGGLNVPQGIYFANGNHEEYRMMQVFDDALRAAGIKVLFDEQADANGLQIIGINYHTGSDIVKMTEVLSKFELDPAKPKILIKHVPNHLEIGEKFGVNLQVSGHTHLGQVWPFTYVTRRIFKEFAYGLHTFGKMQVVTSSGVGTWGPPQRIGTNSELVVITLQA